MFWILYTSDIIQYLSFSIWFISLGIIPSKYICVAANGKVSFFCFMTEWHSTVYICCCSVTKSCPTLRDPMDCSMSGFPFPHHLVEFAQVHVLSLAWHSLSASPALGCLNKGRPLVQQGFPGQTPLSTSSDLVPGMHLWADSAGGCELHQPTFLPPLLRPHGDWSNSVLEGQSLFCLHSFPSPTPRQNFSICPWVITQKYMLEDEDAHLERE